MQIERNEAIRLSKLEIDTDVQALGSMPAP